MNLQERPRLTHEQELAVNLIIHNIQMRKNTHRIRQFKISLPDAIAELGTLTVDTAPSGGKFRFDFGKYPRLLETVFTEVPEFNVPSERLIACKFQSSSAKITVRIPTWCLQDVTPKSQKESEKIPS